MPHQPGGLGDAFESIMAARRLRIRIIAGAIFLAVFGIVFALLKDPGPTPPTESMFALDRGELACAFRSCGRATVATATVEMKPKALSLHLCQDHLDAAAGKKPWDAKKPDHLPMPQRILASAFAGGMLALIAVAIMNKIPTMSAARPARSAVEHGTSPRSPT